MQCKPGDLQKFRWPDKMLEWMETEERCAVQGECSAPMGVYVLADDVAQLTIPDSRLHCCNGFLQGLHQQHQICHEDIEASRHEVSHANNISSGKEIHLRSLALRTVLRGQAATVPHLPAI